MPPLSNGVSRALVAALALGQLACAGSREQAYLPLVEGEWRQKSYFTNPVGPGRLVESIPAEEEFDAWTQLITIQFVEGTEESPRELMERIVARLREKCPELTSTVIAEDETGLSYEWWIDACAVAPDQHELARILRGEEGLHRVAFVARGPRLSPEQREHWVEVISTAIVARNGEPLELYAD